MSSSRMSSSIEPIMLICIPVSHVTQRDSSPTQSSMRSRLFFPLSRPGESPTSLSKKTEAAPKVIWTALQLDKIAKLTEGHWSVFHAVELIVKLAVSASSMPSSHTFKRVRIVAAARLHLAADGEGAGMAVR